jgi:hypothetical protein
MSRPWPQEAGKEGGGEHAHLAPHEIGRQLRQPIVLTLRPAIFDGDILAFDLADFV